MKQCRCCHLDIKPANLIITTDGVVKGIDFGISSKVPENTNDRLELNYCGTVIYMAPEIKALK